MEENVSCKKAKAAKADLARRLDAAKAGGPMHGVALREAVKNKDAQAVEELLAAGWRDIANAKGAT